MLPCLWIESNKLNKKVEIKMKNSIDNIILETAQEALTGVTMREVREWLVLADKDPYAYESALKLRYIPFLRLSSLTKEEMRFVSKGVRSLMGNIIHSLTLELYKTSEDNEPLTFSVSAS